MTSLPNRNRLCQYSLWVDLTLGSQLYWLAKAVQWHVQVCPPEKGSLAWSSDSLNLYSLTLAKLLNLSLCLSFFFGEVKKTMFPHIGLLHRWSVEWDQNCAQALPALSEWSTVHILLQEQCCFHQQQSKGTSCKSCLIETVFFLQVDSTRCWVFSQLCQNGRLNNQHWGTHLFQMIGLAHAAADLRKENEHRVVYHVKDFMFRAEVSIWVYWKVWVGQTATTKLPKSMM